MTHPTTEQRELLELAAKAAGLLYLHHYEPANPALLVPKDEDGDAIEWNPLTDDGDALRLAVKLNLLIDVEDERTDAGNFDAHGYRRESHGSDPYAATRRAITRAAAAIAKGEK